MILILFLIHCVRSETLCQHIEDKQIELKPEMTECLNGYEISNVEKNGNSFYLQDFSKYQRTILNTTGVPEKSISFRFGDNDKKYYFQGNDVTINFSDNIYNVIFIQSNHFGSLTLNQTMEVEKTRIIFNLYTGNLPKKIYGNVVDFSLDVEELTSTLLTYDVVDMNKNLQAKFREAIEKEGKLLYEKI